MSKRRTLYSDLPRSYDQDAARLIKAIGFIMLSCIALAGCALLLAGY